MTESKKHPIYERWKAHILTRQSLFEDDTLTVYPGQGVDSKPRMSVVHNGRLQSDEPKASTS